MTAHPTPPSARTHLIDLPPAVARLLLEASSALGRDQVALAEPLLTEALALAPDCAETNRLMGIAALMRGDHPKAIAHLRRALAARPDDATINMTVGSALFEAGEVDAGLAYLQRACELPPETAAAWYNFGKALQASTRLQQAREALQRALIADPEYIKARNALANVLASLGDTAAAVAIYRETLRERPDCAMAWFELGNLKTEPFTRSDVAQLQSLLHRPDTPDDSRILLKFTLAKAMEDQSDYATAFELVREANALKRRYLYWDRHEERARVEAIADAFSGPMATPLDATLGKEIIFVVCLPRSGSTLTEQILASHPEVEGADEIQTLPEIIDEESRRRGQPFPLWVPSATAEDWQRLGEDYLARTRQWRERFPRSTDKNVSNWAFVGAALAMLPGARVVNSRRDPLETCLACYVQLFNSGVHFSYDLDDMVSYYVGYARLSRLWQQRFPTQYFDHVYESLQADAETQIRRLLSFCELPFDPACLAFHQASRNVLTISAAQVRQPLRTDTARSRRYGDKLAPLRASLREAGLLSADA